VAGLVDERCPFGVKIAFVHRSVVPRRVSQPSAASSSSISVRANSVMSRKSMAAPRRAAVSNVASSRAVFARSIAAGSSSSIRSDGKKVHQRCVQRNRVHRPAERFEQDDEATNAMRNPHRIGGAPP
jgi:hypothetical protein